MNRIPKIIHYCWFGGNPLPDDAKKYIETWKKYNPDYKIIEWNENNFDINRCDYIRDAYKEKKWAFVSDYARLYAIVSMGGIYMDTDVEVLKSFDPFLKYPAFSGFESEEKIPTGTMACEKNFPLFKDLLDEYDSRSFYNKDGTINMTTNVEYITRTCLSKGLKLNGQLQNIEGFYLFPKDYFCAKEYDSGKIYRTNNTVTIHHFSGSWINKYNKTAENIVRKFGVNNFSRVISFPFKFIGMTTDSGLKETVSHYTSKLLKLKNKNQENGK